MAKWLALGCSITDFRVSRELGSHPVHPSGRASGEAGVSGKISQFNATGSAVGHPPPVGDGRHRSALTPGLG